MSESQAEDHDQSTAKPSVGTYFDDTTSKWREIEDERTELKRKQDVLEQIDGEVAKIDRDIGSGSIEIDDGVIWVRVSAPDMCDEVRDLVHEHAWDMEQNISYDMAGACIIWSLKANISTMMDHYSQKAAE